MLSEERRRLRDFSNSTADWFWELDENLKFSVPLRELQGPRRAVRQRSSGDVCPGVYAQDTLNPGEAQGGRLERLRARKSFRDIERCYMDEQGEVQWFSVSGIPVFDDSGVFAGYRGVATIVTRPQARGTGASSATVVCCRSWSITRLRIGVFDLNRECVVRNENYGRILDLPRDLLDRRSRSD